jgi:hypothetical protein
LVDQELVRIDYLNVDTSEFSLALPLGLHTLAITQSKNIIVIAGEPDSGKTALLMETVRLNMDGPYKNRIHYFSSEMGEKEFSTRLGKFERRIETWHFDPYERADTFADVVRPNDINIIDFMELDGSEGREFWRVGAMITEIFKKLRDGIAIIAIQKNPGTSVGLGGQRGMEKPRLYVSLESGQIMDTEDGEQLVHTARIEKCKNWRIERLNPKGMELHFKLAKGCIFKELKHYENGKHWHRHVVERPPTREEYKNDL